MRAAVPGIWLSARGVATMLGLAACLAVASVVHAALYAFGAAAALALALLAADVALGPQRRELRLTRLAVAPLALGRAASLEYVVDNRAAARIHFGLYEAPLPALSFEADHVVGTVGPRSQRSFAFAFTPVNRGSVHFGTLYLWVENRIGLLRRRYSVEAPQDGSVFPDLSALEGSGTLAKRSTLLEAGLRRMHLRGAGSEFESLREYSAGDGFRSIDWKATARRGRPMVRQYEVERSQNVIVALDCGRLMLPRIGARRKLDYALSAALSVGRVAQRSGDSVGLLAFAAKPVLEIAARRGPAHFGALVRAAYGLQPRGEEPDYETVFIGLRNRYAKRSLVVLFSDIFDPVASKSVLAGLQSLIPRHLVVCVLMNDAAIAGALERVAETVPQAYRSAVAMTLADERARAIAILRSRGIIVVDVPAPELTVALLDTYLAIKKRGRL